MMLKFAYMGSSFKCNLLVESNKGLIIDFMATRQRSWYLIVGTVTVISTATTVTIPIIFKI